MKTKVIYIIIFLSATLNNFANNHISSRYSPVYNVIIDTTGKLIYSDAFCFEIKGKYHQEEKFNRLPAKYQPIVRPEVWNLSRNSAGISIRFSTNSPVITVKWKLIYNSNRPTQSKIGVSGLDLYCLINGNWQFVNSAIPRGSTNTSLLISDMDTTLRTFLLNLPLFDGVENVRIGINGKYTILSPTENIDIIHKPIVFYGSSITQGGSASRPGMAYPSIISRKLKVETINLGFSGNGKFEEGIGQALCEIDAVLFVIDCTPNSTPAIIKNNALKLIQQIRDCKPDTPILLVESIIREFSFFSRSDISESGGIAQNKELRQSYDSAVSIGIKNLYYIEGSSLIGSDHEGTVDGTHLTDLGQYRIAEIIGAKIIEILKPQKNTGADKF